MSRGFIKVIAKGNIGQLEAKNLQSGDLVVNFSLASTSAYTDNNGQKVENTTWLKGVAYRKTAELISNLLQKGSEIFLEGKLNVCKWQDQQGNNRETTEVVVDSFELLSRGKQQAANQQQSAGYQQAQQTNSHPPQNQQPVARLNNGRNYQPPRPHQNQHQQTRHGFEVPDFANQ
ncbi:single-stranded DNA-binding protein [Alteromonas oceanisediminis]|uniref:single-stranded DNA-binding protein n=1 Tax=Alteromonas oceanisediminis TaxID=2836180 RepID=UPI001BD9A4F1|nr:single-stranded DNA-binding protein [Alteromonas oceanisediminis]MBT0587974.1 single-stranded DNA-binding protein [Alteromonas oceanisediminis]